MKRFTYQDLTYSIRILNNGDGIYSVEVPKLSGCYSSGRTKAECISGIVEAIQLHLEGVKIPPSPDPIPAIELIDEMPSSIDTLVSLSEACQFLNISDATLRRYIKAGKLPAYNFGKEYRFKLRELSKFIESSRVAVRKLPVGRKKVKIPPDRFRPSARRHKVKKSG